MTAVLGLDLSLTSTGASFQGHDDGDQAWRWVTKPKDGSDECRRRTIADLVHDFVADFQPATVVMESVPTHMAFSIVPLAMLHGLVRDRLDRLCVPSYTVSATTLKKYATGNSKAKKEQMVAAAQAVGYLGKNHDEADAWLLCLLGRHLLGDTDHLTPQRLSCLAAAQLVIGATA